MLPIGNGRYLITKRDYDILNELTEVVFNHDFDFPNAIIDFKKYKLEIPSKNVYTYFDCVSEEEFLDVIPLGIK